ncbi:MAG: glycerate kinase, partial [Chloroflexi bacterium]|nr:glycerate kinase [Chloroflexota bacterium]
SIAAHARIAGVPVVAVVGQVGDGVPDLAGLGIRVVEPLVDHANGAEDALARASEIIPLAAAAAVRRFLESSPLRYN